MGRMPIVVIPMGDEVTPRLLTGQVALFTNRRSVRQPDIAYAVVWRDQLLDRIRAVVHDDQLSGGIVLAQKIFDRPRHEGPPIIGRHDAGDERWDVHGLSSEM